MKWSNLGMPANASAHGAEIDYLMLILHIFMFALFIGWSLFFLYCLVRFRKSKNPTASYHGVRTHASSYLEAGVAIFEALLLIGFSIPLWAKRVQPTRDELQNPLEIHVVAQQFAWLIHYPGTDGIWGRRDMRLIAPTNQLGLDRHDPAAKDDIVSFNELHCLIDRPVIVHLTTKDVVHSFFLPAMRVKQDIIPGMSIPVWFTPVKTGDSEIACAQLCGNGHAAMRGYLYVDTPEEYAKWLKEMQENQ
jgi:cytochrome c oxidase subunit 2